MNIKHRPNHGAFIAVLRRMTPEARLLKAFELSAFAQGLFLHGLRCRFPDLAETQLKRLALERLRKCHNKNY